MVGCAKDAGEEGVCARNVARVPKGWGTRLGELVEEGGRPDGAGRRVGSGSEAAVPRLSTASKATTRQARPGCSPPYRSGGRRDLTTGAAESARCPPPTP